MSATYHLGLKFFPDLHHRSVEFPVFTYFIKIFNILYFVLLLFQNILGVPSQLMFSLVFIKPGCVSFNSRRLQILVHSLPTPYHSYTQKFSQIIERPGYTVAHRPKYILKNPLGNSIDEIDHPGKS